MALAALYSMRYCRAFPHLVRSIPVCFAWPIDVDGFYGYYTIDILRDGRIAGMLSVNGYTRQVFLHTWHGNLLEMVEGTQN